MKRTAFLAAILALHCQALSGAEFTPTTSLPDGYTGHALLAASGHLYHIGGLSQSDGVLAGKKMFCAPILTPGAIGEWTEGPELPEAMFFHASAASGDTLYVLGGHHFNGGLHTSDKVYFSRLGADGTPGAWQETAPMPQALFLHSAAVWHDMLYVTGGWGPGILSSKVYAAHIQADGSLSGWAEMTPLPEAVYTHATVQDDTLYVLGGVISGGAEIHSQVYFSPIKPDGTLDGWLETTPLLQPLSSHAAAVAGGKVFVLGGWTGTEPTAQAAGAAILSDKTLGEWQEIAPLPKPLYLHAAASSGDAIYISGGSDGSSSQSGVYGMPLETQLAATVEIHPDRLNLFNLGMYVTAYLEFPAASGVTAADIDAGSIRVVRVNGHDVAPLAPLGHPRSLGDEDQDGVQELMVKFFRLSFVLRLDIGDNLVELEGRLNDGREFTGEASVWALNPIKRFVQKRKLFDRAQARRKYFNHLRVCNRAAFGMVTRVGGKIRCDSRAAVEVPDGATEGAYITVSEAVPGSAEAAAQEDAQEAQGLAPAGEGVEYGPEGMTFDEPVTLELPYDPDRLPAGEKEDDLQVHYWNRAKGVWEALASVVDKADKVVRARTSHFSDYQVMSGGAQVQGPSIPGVDFGEVYAFPNPARGDQDPVLHVEAGSADRLDVRIYDLSGELVNSGSLGGPAPSVDDGSGRGPVPAFEYAWDASGAGSGVYIYVVTAHKAGYGSIRKSGKLAVIK